MKRFNNLGNCKNFRKKLRNNATPQEIILWARLRKSQLKFKFRRQHSIGKYIVDFYCPARKLIIEIDGSQHDDKDVKIYDKKRTQYFESLGLRVLRFWDNEININLKGIVLKIIQYLD